MSALIPAILGVSLGAEAKSPQPKKLAVLKYKVEFILKAVLEHKGLEYRADIALPAVIVSSKADLKTFQDDVEPQWGLAALDVSASSASDSVRGGYLVVWDYGTPAPPTVNLPPTSPEYGNDPHGAGSSEQRVLRQALTFLLEGRFDDVCAGAPCVGAPA